MTAEKNVYTYECEPHGQSASRTGKVSATLYGQTFIVTAFGERLASFRSLSTINSSLSIEQRYTYTGRESSAVSGNYYFRCRWYGAGVGGFLIRDPLGYVDGMSQYGGYFADAMEIDPYGNLCCGVGDNAKDYNDETHCCFKGRVFRRLPNTIEKCDANYRNNMKGVLKSLKKMGVSNAIGEAAWGTLVSTVLGYAGGAVVGGLSVGGPIGALVSGAFPGLIGIYSISAEIKRARREAGEIAEVYERCKACMQKRRYLRQLSNY